jgi:hypothetical protein
LNTLLRLVSGIYFVLTSIYCLLAFLPYTFFFLIKAPPYSWMPWFVRHQATLYSVAASAAVAANWPLREAWAKREHRFLIGAGLLLAAGVYLEPPSISASPRRQSRGLSLEPGELASPDCLCAVAPSRRQTCRTEWFLKTDN